jgi:hypothetical protein
MYHGYPNRATWNVVLWALNTENVYRFIVERPMAFTARSAMFACKDVIFKSEITPDGDNLSEVDWERVAEAFNEAK